MNKKPGSKKNEFKLNTEIDANKKAAIHTAAFKILLVNLIFDNFLLVN